MSCITKVRQGVMQDLPAIYNLIKELLPSNGRSKLSLEDFRKFGFGDERLFHSFVAEVPGPRETGRHRPVELPAEKRIVGCVLYSMAFDYQVGRQVYLQGLAVNPDFQRKCVATALVEASLEAGRVAGCSEGTALIYTETTTDPERSSNCDSVRRTTRSNTIGACSPCPYTINTRVCLIRNKQRTNTNLDHLHLKWII